MNLKLPALVPWMVLAGVAYGQVRTADVLYTFQEATPQPGYRLGDECFVALDTPEQWGWKVKKSSDSVDVTAEGHTVHLTTRYVSGKMVIPLRKVITELGGQTEWTPGADTFNVFSNLTQVTVRNGKVHVQSPLPFKPTAFFLNPGRTVIDLDGARIAPGTEQQVDSGVRIGQFRPNVVRIVIQTDFVPKLPEGKISETKNFDFQVSKDADLPESPVREPDPTPPPVVHPPVTAPKSDPQDPFPDHVPPITPIQQPTTNQVPAGPVPLTMTVDQDTTRSSSIDFRLPIPFTKQATINKPDPDTIRITLPGVATLALTDTPIVSGVDSVTSQTIGMNTVITVELSRAMGAEVTSSATGVSLRLLKPNVGNGKLAGKVIVVDPGHGGHDRGTHVGLVNEKDLNLSIGTKLAAKLAEAGATVILTRRTDVFIPLMTRSAISNQNHADLFISCHINSTGGEPNQSGTITFHHEGNNVGKLLAECIQDEIAKVNRLPNMGVWSDGRIYETGFSVLRHTHAPAVLIEMGFLNCAKDRARMMTEDFQDAVTTAVVKGLRIYLGDSKPNE